MPRIPLAAALIACALPTMAQAQLQVVSTTPALNARVAVGTTISVEFDRALDTGTIDVDTFRVFAQGSGPVRGDFAFSNADKTVTLTPDFPFSAGETVFVNLSHDIKAADLSSLRAEGWAWQFSTAVTPSAGTFDQIDSFSNRTGPNTRIYGAAATDLNGDRYRDLATVNEDSADVRVFLNQADGSGLFGSMLSPEPIGVESSPNESADFDNDGNVDLCTSAASDQSLSVLLGAGDGTFSSNTEIPLGGAPHGIAVLDVDGDADPDIVDANVGSNNLALLLNDGSGNFGVPTFFEGGVNGEYGLAAADMNGDGITDLVVGGRNGGQVNTMLGNGDGTFTAAGPAQSAGGGTWVVFLGDVNGDGDLDVASANDGSANVGILLGNGDGTFDPPTLIDTDAHTPSVDLGDLDGDGDLDMVVSIFGGGQWRRYSNDGTGTFTLVETYFADDSPSCSILFDADNDGDLDMALTDELADTIRIMQNSTVSVCSPTPLACRTPIEAGKSKLTLKDRSPSTSDGLSWKWTKGATTPKADFGNPLAADTYELCLYEDGALVQSWQMPAGQLCAGKPCWKESDKGFSYKDKDRSPDGMQSLKLTQGLLPGKAKVTAKGKGDFLDMPLLGDLTGVLDVQLQKSGGGACWGATFTPPFRKNDGATLQAVSDAPVTTTTTTTSTTTTTLSPTWAAIHSQVIGPVCAGCHGGQGGLSGLGDCDTAHANLVNVASTELLTMDRVEPGDATNSWLMHKLDGTQGGFTAQCVGMFCGGQMPLGGPFLSMSTRDAIRTWITNGAVNDCP